MSDEPPVSMGRTFRYTSIACEIIIFAFVGWIIGPAIWGPGGDILGAMIGAIIGTLMMFCTLFYLAGLFGQKKESGVKEEELPREGKR
ncbi:MAG: hypothetical protein ACFE89_08655 [Candidatus Hodarchaeota archaeon]